MAAKSHSTTTQPHSANGSKPSDVRELRIVISADRVYVADADGNHLTAASYDTLFDLLREARRQRRQHEDAALLANAIFDATWIVPTRPQDTFKSGPCVYFMACDAMPNLVKIGFTHQLSTRRSVLQKEYGDAIRVLVFAKTDHHKQLERALHAYFAAARVGDSEWFDARAVVPWLRERGYAR